MKQLEEKFNAEVLQCCAKAKLEYGLDTAQMENDINRLGAAAMLRQLTKRGAVSVLFDQLKEKGQLCLSPEAVASKVEYASLFTDKEADWFLEQLCQGGYY